MTIVNTLKRDETDKSCEELNPFHPKIPRAFAIFILIVSFDY